MTPQDTYESMRSVLPERLSKWKLLGDVEAKSSNPPSSNSSTLNLAGVLVFCFWRCLSAKPSKWQSKPI